MAPPSRTTTYVCHRRNLEISAWLRTDEKCFDGRLSGFVLWFRAYQGMHRSGYRLAASTWQTVGELNPCVGRHACSPPPGDFRHSGWDRVFTSPGTP
jgi:hypothetical protein